MSAGASVANEPNDEVNGSEHGCSRTCGNAIPTNVTGETTNGRSENVSDGFRHGVQTVADGVSAM